MSERDPKKVFYELQFNVVSYSAYGVPIQVCFHGPKAMGFSSIEMAEKVKAKLEEGDAKANRTHIYEIQPVMVAEDFGIGPEITFAGDNDQDLMEDLPTDEDEPPPSN